MTSLVHNNTTIQTISTDWQTQARGSNCNEYEIYCTFAGDANGIDTTTGNPLKTYDEWLNS